MNIRPLCLTTTSISFLYVENVPPSRVLFPSMNRKYHTVCQARAGDLAILPTKTWSPCTPWICAWPWNWLWPIRHSQKWHKQGLEKWLSTGAYCHWEPYDYHMKKSGLASLRSRGHSERGSVPITPVKDSSMWDIWGHPAPAEPAQTRRISQPNHRILRNNEHVLF